MDLRQTIIEMYLDYLNNFLTLKGFAAYYDLTATDALQIITTGRRLNGRR